MPRIGSTRRGRPLASRQFRLAFVAIWAAIGVFHAWSGATRGEQAPAASDRLVLLDGTVITTRSLKIGQEAIRGEGVPPNLQLDDLRRVERTAVTLEPQPTPASWVELRGGTRLAVNSVSIAGEKCRLRWLDEQDLEFPLDAIRTIRLQPTASAALDQGRINASAEQDRVLIRDQAGHETIITGLVESLTKEQLQLSVDGQSRAIPAANLATIVFAQPASAQPPAPITVQLRDASLLVGRGLKVSGARATLIVDGNTRVAFRWDDVNRVLVRSPRIAFLSDLEPETQTQRPIVSPEFPARRDASATGRPLRIGSQVIEKGLGVHAYSALTFALGGQWDRFAATIGLDPAAGGKGDCIFKVLADRDTIFSRRLQAGDSPQSLDLPIAGRKRITLVVEPGEDLDLGDYANWYDARFIKSKP